MLPVLIAFNSNGNKGSINKITLEFYISAAIHIKLAFSLLKLVALLCLQ